MNRAGGEAVQLGPQPAQLGPQARPTLAALADGKLMARGHCRSGEWRLPGPQPPAELVQGPPLASVGIVKSRPRGANSTRTSSTHAAASGAERRPALRSPQVPTWDDLHARLPPASWAPTPPVNGGGKNAWWKLTAYISNIIKGCI